VLEAKTSMTKSELIQSIGTRMPHLQTQNLQRAVNTLFDSIADELRQGRRTEIRGFGSFSVRHRRARQGRNPKTGTSTAVPAKRVPFFVTGKKLAERVNENRLKYPIAKDETNPMGSS
jgi:integration host factor subunit beta